MFPQFWYALQYEIVCQRFNMFSFKQIVKLCDTPLHTHRIIVTIWSEFYHKFISFLEPSIESVWILAFFCPQLEPFYLNLNCFSSLFFSFLFLNVYVNMLLLHTARVYNFIIHFITNKERLLLLCFLVCTLWIFFYIVQISILLRRIRTSFRNIVEHFQTLKIHFYL